MSTWKDVLREKVLNLPTKEERAEAQKKGWRSRRRPSDAVGLEEPSRAAAPTDNPWKAAGASSPEQDKPVRPVTTSTGVPWRLVDDTRGARSWRRVGRTALVVVVGLFTWVGVREAFFTGNDVPEASLPVEVTFDKSAAAGVATRFASTALTWNEDTPETHEQGVAMDYAQGADPVGWNGKGRQDVTAAIPGPVEVADDGESAIVSVYTKVTTYDRESSSTPWTATGTQWLTVEVPVAEAQDGSRLVATGGPSISGSAAPSAPEATEPATEDAELTSATRAIAEAFFHDYGEGDVTAVEAPGASIAAPQDPWTFKALTSWTVDAGTGDKRRAHATVTWSIEGLTQEVTQTYAATLTRVSSGGEDRWQVATITAE